MEANDFLAKIKENVNEKDWCNLAKVYDDYKAVASKLSTKERGSFSLNVLCLLCRNLDKAPTWRESIDTKDLLTLTIDCIRETRGLNKPEQVKTLACIYHIHRYVVRKNAPVPPELILKLSFMPFEAEPNNLLKEYSKTYWNIVADRLIYIEKLKGKAIHKLLPKLTEDLLKTLEVYDTAQFCENILVFLVKKLHFIYSENYAEQLNVLYGEIFEKLSRKTDLGMFKKLKEKTTLDLYVKFSDCLYVITENSSKNRFKESTLTVAVRAVTTILGHRSDIFHCLQTFYLNSFCDIFVNKTTYLDAVFKNLTVSCEITEKLGYKDTMLATYPFIGQFLRLFIEYSINNGIKINFTQEIQENCLNFVIKLLNELKNCDQLLKCENCKVKSGLHDALRLSFLLKHFITNAVENNCDLNNLLPLYNTVIETQYSIMGELKKLACVNYEKCYRKLQTDTHNTAILLNKNQKYEFSINLFEVYIKNELSVTKKEFEHKNVARAFYNKSICELDYKKHENALFDAFLSLIFSKDLNSDKYMSLVMDIKAKALKCDDRNDDEDDDDEKSDDLQLLSVVEACRIVMEQKIYGDLTPFLKDVKFSLLLKHEFDMYCKLWPSIVPVAGVWRSLNSLLNGKQEKWMTVEDPESLLWMLLEVISVTPEAVRTIHSDYFKAIVNELLERIDKMPEPISSDFQVAQTILLFLKAEYDIAEASAKYGWKVTETSIDPDLMQAMRSISQEHEALQKALQAVEIWTELAVVLDTVTNKCLLRPALQLAQIFVRQLLHFSRTAHALQLAHVCCQIAIYVDDKEAYLLNSGILLSEMNKACPSLRAILSQATEYWPALIQAAHSLETALVFVCDAAIYYNKIGQTGVSAKLVQLAQTRILTSYEKYPDVNLELAVGRLMEAQTLLCRDSGLSTMSAVNATQRHYLSISNTASKWYPRRLRGLTLKQRIYSSSARGVRTARVLQLWRRARSACAVALPACSAPQQAAMYADIVNVYRMDDAQVKIDNRLKYILDIPSNEQPSTAVEPKVERFAPKQDFEIMLECQSFKSQISPTRKYVTIPGFKMAEFFRHNSCDCYACENPVCPIIAYITGGLEASMYFRANEFEIAGNYFKGVINTFGFFEDKLKHVLKAYSDLDFEKYVIDCVRRMFEDKFRKVKLEVLIEASFYELKNCNFDAADDYIVTIHEIVQDLEEEDSYLSNEVMNLLIASAKVRNVVKKQEFDLEAEFENLKLSPKAKTEGQKTPESNAKLPQAKPSARKVKDEELPKKRKVIKLNLDENSSDEKEVEKPKPRKKVSEFKIPVPVTSKPVIENLTPRPTRKPVITITDTTKTPKVDKKEELNEFFTPQSTPEQFFTPLNTIKTYSKSKQTTLRKGIVKNLEQEFSTPKAGLAKENVNRTELPTRSGRKDEKERALKRATSPGKLTDSQTRPRRVRQPKI